MLNNLLDIPVLGPVLRSSWTWRLLRLVMLVLLVVMIAYGWHQHTIPGVKVRDPLMYTSLTTFGLWVVWMMGMVAVALVFGRSWCTICPAGWLNGLVSRFGLRREIPGWLQNFIPVTLVLVVLQLLVYIFSIHRFPDDSALLLLWMALLAVAAGLIFKRRAFCLLLCPAGAVFGLYARLAPWQLRVKDTSVCDDCAGKPCVSTVSFWKQARLGNARLQWRSRNEGCPVDLTLAEIDESATCTLCLNCVQTCCNDNIKLGFRRFPGDLRKGGLRHSETFFFLALLGLLTANFSKVYVDLREAVFWVPERIALGLGWDVEGFYPMAVVWLSLIFPLLLMLPGVIVTLVGQVRVSTSANEADSASLAPAASPFGEGGWLGLLGRLAVPMLPLVLATHLVLALVKLNAKLGYLPLVLQDTSGVKSYLAISVMNTLQAPGVLVPLDILKWVVVGLLAIGLLASAFAAKVIAGGERGHVDVPFLVAVLCNLLVLVSLYGATVFEWLFVR